MTVSLTIVNEIACAQNDPKSIADQVGMPASAGTPAPSTEAQISSRDSYVVELPMLQGTFQDQKKGSNQSCESGLGQPTLLESSWGNVVMSLATPKLLCLKS